MIILNEAEYAENILNSNTYIDNPTTCIPILAKYYNKTYNFGKKRIVDSLDRLMTDRYQNYSRMRWISFLESCANKAKKSSLNEIDSIGVTKKEMDTIGSLNSIRTEKAMFAILCIAKYFNIRNEKNNGWVNLSAKDIFKMANVNITTINQDLLINVLYSNGLVEFSKRIDNLNMRVTFIDNSGDALLKVSDFRCLGYEYVNWKQGGYFRCAECGILCKQNKYGNRIYCNNCVGNIPIAKKTIACIDCGCNFDIDAKDNQTDRCPECYKKYRRKFKTEKQREYRNK